jgi:hypothetical protein
VTETRPEPVFPVGFDEDALSEDLERLSEGAVEALEAFRKELRREGGIPQSRLKACHDEGQDGTMLGGCVKTYVPVAGRSLRRGVRGGEAPESPAGPTRIRLRRPAPSARVKSRNRLRSRQSAAGATVLVRVPCRPIASLPWLHASNSSNVLRDLRRADLPRPVPVA